MSRRVTIPHQTVGRGGPRIQNRGKTKRASIAKWCALLHMWERLLIAGILLITIVAHGWNMFNFPYFETDEGTYMSQAWAVISENRLAPYTYIYDHAPAGWLQIAGWVTVTGGFDTFGGSIESGRVLMLVFQLASTFLLYRIARSITGSIMIATITALLFALSAYGILYHRRVLLDNIATFWMLLAIWALVSGRLSLSKVWLSAVALGISILSKEITLFLIPALMLLAYQRAYKTQRAFIVLGWLAIVSSLFSIYILLATLKNELFPPEFARIAGFVLGGTDPHVSLIDTLRWQAGRNKDGGLLDTSSKFWQLANLWVRDEPLLVIGGTASALIGLVTFRRQPLMGSLSLATFSLWAFLCRGGETLNFYLLPLLPLFALNIGLSINFLTHWVIESRHLARALPAAKKLLPAGVLTALSLSGLLVGYSSPNLGVESRPITNSRSALGTLPWEGTQSLAQRQATTWIRQNISPDAAIIMDNYAWTELHDGTNGQPIYPRAHWYWKVQQDDTVKVGVFHNDWRYVDYVVTTSQLLNDATVNDLTLVNEAVKHSSPVITFDTGGWPIVVRRVDKLHQWPAPSDPLLTRSWANFKATYIENGRVVDPANDRVTTADAQAQALLQATYMNDQQAFRQLWSWTQKNLQTSSSNLMATAWGKRADGSLGAFDSGNIIGADQDAALALLFAARRWQLTEYQTAATVLLQSIWEHNTVSVGGRRIIVADVNTTTENGFLTSPAYFAPYAYHIFASIDTKHDWNSLVDSSYDILAQISLQPELGGAVGVVPDWIAIDHETGKLSPAAQVSAGAGDFANTAAQVPFRLTLDWLWFQDDRARVALKAISLPQREIARTAGEGGIWMAATYDLNGTPTTNSEALTTYAGTLGGLLFSDRTLAFQVYGEKILETYQHGPSWGNPESQRDQLWGWYATALLNGAMSNTWAGQPFVRFDQVLP